MLGLQARYCGPTAVVGARDGREGAVGRLPTNDAVVGGQENEDVRRWCHVCAAHVRMNCLHTIYTNTVSDNSLLQVGATHFTCSTLFHSIGIHNLIKYGRFGQIGGCVRLLRYHDAWRGSRHSPSGDIVL